MKWLLAGVVLWTALGMPVAQAGPKEAKHLVLDVVAINGEDFVVKDDAGTEGTIHVGTDTEKYGHFQPGDRIDAWVYPDGHAKTVIILRSAAIVQEDQRQQAAAQQEQR